MKKIIKPLPQYESRLFKEIYEICFDGVSCILYKNELEQYRKECEESKYRDWYHFTRNAYYDEAVLRWCMLFGSCREPTHYLNLLDTESIKSILEKLNLDSKSKLREYVLRKMRISLDDYKVYHEGVKSYRDRNLVHREFSPLKINDGDLSYPRCDIPEKAFSSLIDLLRAIGSKILNVNEHSEIFYYDCESEDLKKILKDNIPRTEVHGKNS